MCLYASSMLGMFAVGGYAPGALRDHAFLVGYIPNGPAVQDLYIYATWAYRAP